MPQAATPAAGASAQPHPWLIWLTRVRQGLVLTTLVVVPLALVPGQSSPIYAKAAVAMLLLIPTCAVGIWEILAHRTIRLTPLFVPVLLLIAAASVSFVASVNVLISLKSLVALVSFALFGFVLANTVRSRAEVTVYVFALTIAAAGATVLAMLEFSGLRQTNPDVPSGFAAVYSTFGHRNYLAGFLADVLALSIPLTLWPGLRLRWRVLLAVLALVSFGGLLVTFTRGAWLALAVALVGFVILQATTGRYTRRAPLPRRHSRRLAIALFILSLGGLGVILFLAMRPTGQPLPVGVLIPVAGRWARGEGYQPALYNASHGVFHLNALQRVPFVSQEQLLPVVGDWLGDGVDRPGVFAESERTFVLMMREHPRENLRLPVSGAVPFAVPVAGDWKGDGVYGLGLFHAATATWQIWYEPREGVPDLQFAFGRGKDDDWPVAGDWDGDGRWEVGIYYRDEKVFDLLLALPGGESARVTHQVPAPFAQDGDLPLTGDWTGTGRTSVGVFDPHRGIFRLDSGLTGVAGLTRHWQQATWLDIGQQRLAARQPVRDRIALWSVSLAMIRDHPVFGVGLANYKLRFVEYKAELLKSPLGRAYYGDRYMLRAEHAHNEILHWATETGLLGALALVLFIGVLFRSGLSRPALESGLEANWLRLALFSGVIGVLVHSLVSFPMHLAASALVFVTYAGLLCSPVSRSEFQERRLPTGIRRLGPGLMGILSAMMLVLALRDYVADRAYFRGRVAIALGQMDTARDELIRSVELGLPAPGQASILLGLLAEQRGQVQEAYEHFQRGLGSAASEIAYQRAALAALATGRSEQVRRYLNTLLHVAPENHELTQNARLLEATLEVYYGDFVEGQRKIDLLAREFPQNWRVMSLRAQLAAQNGDTDDARAYFHAARAIVRRQLDRARMELIGLSQRGVASVGRVSDLRGQIAQLQRQLQFIDRSLSDLAHAEDQSQP